MDHKDFLSSLPVETRSGLTAKSDRLGLVHLAGHAGLILGLGALIAMRVPGWWALLPLQGVALIFLFTLEHEATHKTPFANQTLNEWVGRLCGFVILLPFEWFRYFHLAHHRWTNIAGHDPELEGGKPENRLAWVWHVSGIPYWHAQMRLLIRLSLCKGTASYIPHAALPRIRREALGMVIGYGAVAASLFLSPTAIWVWIVPILIGQPALRLYLLAEHGDCPRVANMFENTRTTFTTKAMRFLAWNMPYHVEHHVYPSVPFHQLPALHGLIKANLVITAEGYVAFTKDYLARRS